MNEEKNNHAAVSMGNMIFVIGSKHHKLISKIKVMFLFVFQYHFINFLSFIRFVFLFSIISTKVNNNRFKIQIKSILVTFN